MMQHLRPGVLEPLLKSGDELAKVKGEDAKATVEIIDWVPPAERVTVWWQVLAYLIPTVAEILISVTGLELAFVAAPPSMKSFVTGLWLGHGGPCESRDQCPNHASLSIHAAGWHMPCWVWRWLW